MNKKKILQWTALVLSLLMLCLIIGTASLCIGATDISLKRVLRVLLEGKGTAEYSILVNIRLPRIILGLAVGGALSLAGAILQGIFRNPLVEPYTLGISGGAALGVSVTIVFKLYHFFGVMAYPMSGFLGAAFIIFFVYSLSSKRGIMKIQGMLLTGVMISFISSSIIMLIMALSKSEDIHGIVFWQMGSLDEPNLYLILVTVGCSLLGLVLSYFFCLDLNAFALGEEAAAHLGINVERTKLLLFLIASMLTGLSVSVAGIIGFVGLVVPHVIRIFTGPDHRILFIASFLAGAAFLIFCDTLARTIIAPIELPVGVITGIIGGLAFIIILNKRAVRL